MKQIITRVAGGAAVAAAAAAVAIPGIAGAAIPVNPGPTPTLHVYPTPPAQGTSLINSVSIQMSVDTGSPAATCRYVILDDGVDTAPSSIAWGGASGFPSYYNFGTDINNVAGSTNSITDTVQVLGNDGVDTTGEINGPGTYKVQSTCWWNGDATSASYGPVQTFTVTEGTPATDDAAAVPGTITVGGSATPTPPTDGGEDSTGSLGSLFNFGSLGSSGGATAGGGVNAGGGFNFGS